MVQKLKWGGGRGGTPPPFPDPTSGYVPAILFYSMLLKLEDLRKRSMRSIPLRWISVAKKVMESACAFPKIPFVNYFGKLAARVNTEHAFLSVE